MSTSLWRNRHDDSKTDASLDKVQFSVSENIVGVYWPVEVEPGESLSWTEYEHRAEKKGYTDQDAWVRALGAIRSNMQEDDLCYTRDASGQFYLGRVIGPWRYETDPEYKRHELVNVRDCKWYQIRDPEETIPTELLESFKRGAVLQRIKNPRLLAFSQRLFEIIDDEEHYDIDLPYTLDDWLSDDDLKDLLALDLQIDQDQILLPSTVDQEVFLPDGITVKRQSADRTLYQVQHQHDELPAGAYTEDDRRVIYLKREDGSRHGLSDKVEVRPLKSLQTVFENHWDFLPRRLRIIGDLLREKGSLTKTETRSSQRESEADTEEKSSRKPAEFSTRSMIFFVVGVLLGLVLMFSYGRWTGGATSTTESTLAQEERVALEQEVKTLRASQEELIAERNELRKNLAALKEANQSKKQSDSPRDTNWVNVQVLRNDTLSELLERFQGSQNLQDQVVTRNNLTNRDLIYTGSTLSFPSTTTTQRNQFEKNRTP